MATENVTAINITAEYEPEVLALINEFASLQHLKPTTALKQYLLQTLPAKVVELKQSIQINNVSQG